MYRVGVINDFRDTRSFIDYKEYGELKAWDASWTKGSSPNHAGDIGVFLNFRLIGRYKTKSEAYNVLKKLIDEAPTSFFRENADYLLRDLC
jgi:hypothetical protein